MAGAIEQVIFKPDEVVDFGIPGVSIQATLYSTYDPYSGMDLTQVDTTTTEFNTEEYWNLDSDGRPSLGLFFIKDDNISENEFTENIPDELFIQIPKINLITNGTGRIVKSFNYFNNSLGEGNNTGDYAESGYSFKPAGGWDYIGYDGVGYSLIAISQDLVENPISGDDELPTPVGSLQWYYINNPYMYRTSLVNQQIDTNLNGIPDGGELENDNNLDNVDGIPYEHYFKQSPNNFITAEQSLSILDEQTFINPNPFEILSDLLPTEWSNGIVGNDFTQYGGVGDEYLIPAGTTIPPYFATEEANFWSEEEGVIIDGIEFPSMGNYTKHVSNLICSKLGYDRAKFILDEEPKTQAFESSEWQTIGFSSTIFSGNWPIDVSTPLLPRLTNYQLEMFAENPLYNEWELQATNILGVEYDDPQYYISELTCQNTEVISNATIQNNHPSGQFAYAGYYPYIVATEHSIEALTSSPPTADYQGSLNIDYQWAKWVIDSECRSYNRCLKFKADENYKEIGNLLNDVSNITSPEIGSLEDCSHNYEVIQAGDESMYLEYNYTDTCSTANEKCAGLFYTPQIPENAQEGNIVPGLITGKCVNPRNYVDGWFNNDFDEGGDYDAYSLHNCNNEVDRTKMDQSLCNFNPSTAEFGGIHQYCVELTNDISTLVEDGYGGDETHPYYQCVSHINPSISEGSFELQAANEVLALSNENQYRTLNQYQQIYSQGDDTLNPFSSLKVSFYMKTTEAQGYTVNPDRFRFPAVESAIVQNEPKLEAQTLSTTVAGLGTIDVYTSGDFANAVYLYQDYTEGTYTWNFSAFTNNAFNQNNFPDNSQSQQVEVTKVEIRGDFGNSQADLVSLTIGGVSFSADDISNHPTGYQETYSTLWEGTKIVNLNSDNKLNVSCQTINVYGYGFSTYYQDSNGDTFSQSQTIGFKIHTRVIHKYDRTKRLSSRDTLNTDIMYSIGRNNSITNDNNTALSPFGSMNRFQNSELNKWEKFEYDFNLTTHHLSNFPAYGITHDGTPGEQALNVDINNIKDLYFTIQASMNNDNESFWGTVYIDDIVVTESYDFNPDVDVRKKKGPNDFGIADLTQYYDKELQPDEYKDTTAPLEVQFYFYPRYPYDNFLDSTPPIIYNDFRDGRFYVYDIDWGDGSINEFTSEPELLGPNISLYHTYENHGIYEITGTMIRMKPDKEGVVNGIIHHKKFKLQININEGRDEDFEYFGSEGFSFIPYKEIVPTIGGYGEESIYYKSITRQLGILGDNMIVNSQFKHQGDKLKTEIALNKMTDKFDNYLDLINEFKKERYSEPNQSGEIIYNGMKLHTAELGKSTGDLDLTNIKYFNTIKPMWEMLGFEEENYPIHPEAHMITNLSDLGFPDDDGTVSFRVWPSNWNVLTTVVDTNQTVNLHMENFPKLSNGYIDAYIESEVYCSSADWHPTYIEITSTTNLDGDVENKQGFRKHIPTSGINPGTENEGTWIQGNNYFKAYIGDNSDGGSVYYMPAEGGSSVNTYQDLYDFNRIQIGRTTDCQYDPTTGGYLGDCTGSPDDNINFEYLGIRPANIQLSYLEILAQNIVGVENNLTHPGNPDSLSYWKRIIPKDYSILKRDGINQAELETLLNNGIISGSQIITTDSNQDWLDENNDGMPDYYYPVLPKYSIDGRFTNTFPTASSGIEKIKFPEDGLITNEDYVDDTLLISINSVEKENNILEDYSGNKNHGFTYNDYKPIFDKQTLKPKKTKSINQTKTTTNDGAF